MSIHKEFISALIHAAWKSETLNIGGGVFKYDEYAELIDIYKAAPDLLAALEKILVLNATQGVGYDEWEGAIEMADKAIAKAKGESCPQ